MTPKVAVYLYPWDLARLGVDQVLGDLEANNVTSIDLAANYHVITAISPRGNGMRVFFTPRGSVFFPARGERYARIKPLLWTDRSVVDIWSDVANKSASRSIDLNAWTITMYQPWIAQDFPFAARVMPTGDRSDTGICPNSPDVQEYLGIFAADLAELFPINYFSLEGNCIPAYDYGWLRPRRLVNVSQLAKDLLRMCFCDSCIALAKSKGLDVTGLHQRTLDLLSKFGTQSKGLVTPPSDEVFSQDEELFTFSQLGSDGAEAVIKSMHGALTANKLSSGIVIAAPGPELGGYGARLENVIDDISGIHLTEFESFEDQRQFVADVRERAPQLLVDLLFQPPLVASAPTITPSFDYEDPDYLARTHDALGVGLDQITIYHYSLFDDSEFQSVLNSLGLASH